MVNKLRRGKMRGRDDEIVGAQRRHSRRTAGVQMPRMATRGTAAPEIKPASSNCAKLLSLRLDSCFHAGMTALARRALRAAASPLLVMPEACP